MTFDVGSLVRARGREWVVLPESDPAAHLLVLRPLGGSDDDKAGIYLPLEHVEAASFALPDPSRDLGNDRSARLLRDAVRLGFRSGAGPFRSLAGIAIEPRPYQLVPLLMALKLDPVRLLLADDVGIGKTIEAGLIARELLDRGEIRRLAVLCPPHLAEQWQRELDQKFHLRAELVLSGTAARLERDCGLGETLFERHPITIVSTDYVKQERRRHTFLNHCPEFVIVDEAHTCSMGGGGARQRRHELLRDLSRDASRHMLLVTATPHSGKDETFRSLLSLLSPELATLPDDLSGEQNRRHRDHLARYFVQRRRGDLKNYLGTDTVFPNREAAELDYALHPEYRAFFQRILAWCEEQVTTPGLDRRHQRVRWWSALALLRGVSSSPIAAAATLRTRSSAAALDTVEGVDTEGERAVMDLDDEALEGIDVIPGSDPSLDDDGTHPERRRLLDFAREAERLASEGKDHKLTRMVAIVKELLDQGYSPILFCRFIPTVAYVTEALRKALKKDVVVEGVDGTLPAAAREAKVEALATNPRRVLVCTDCLSEGVNLQHSFDAVVHYDLSWNPTRHEQRDGRVDRYGQPKRTVRTLTYYGKDNPVDGIVLDVLIRKHEAIKRALGIAVPVPMNSNAVVEAIMEGLILRRQTPAEQLILDLGQTPRLMELNAAWDAAEVEEQRSRTLFRQHALEKAVNDEVAGELAEVRRALGSTADVERFVLTALRDLEGTVSRQGPPWTIALGARPRHLVDVLGAAPLSVQFTGHAPAGTELVTRTHPITEAVAGHVLETALDDRQESPARRCAVIRTRAVSIRTTVLLLRMRFHIVTEVNDGTRRPLLAEDQRLVAFSGSPDAPTFLDDAAAEALLSAAPEANVDPGVARAQLTRVLERFDALWPTLEATARRRGEVLLDAHRRVRKAASLRIRSLRVETHGRPDVVGLYVYLPVGGAA